MKRRKRDFLSDNLLVFDSRLRNGGQARGLAFNIRNKLYIAHQLQRSRMAGSST